MGREQLQQEVLDIGEDTYKSIHQLQETKWANKWLNHSRSKKLKREYLKLLFKSHSLCLQATRNNGKDNIITKEDFEALFDEFLDLVKKLQMIEAEIKVKEFLDTLCK